MKRDSRRRRRKPRQRQQARLDQELNRPLTDNERADLEQEIAEAIGGDGINEEEGSDISKDVVIGLLGQIEYHQQAMRRASDRFERWLERSDELQTVWKTFLVSGGINAHDFLAFLDGRFRSRRIRQRRHLRLVTDKA